ncbi:unnamed protein product, partial [Ectocarpus sp. 4 AP-2014]
VWFCTCFYSRSRPVSVCVCLSVSVWLSFSISFVSLWPVILVTPFVVVVVVVFTLKTDPISRYPVPPSYVRPDPTLDAVGSRGHRLTHPKKVPSNKLAPRGPQVNRNQRQILWSSPLPLRAMRGNPHA